MIDLGIILFVLVVMLLLVLIYRDFNRSKKEQLKVFLEDEHRLHERLDEIDEQVKAAKKDKKQHG